jgi:hypothetical protein
MTESSVAVLAIAFSFTARPFDPAILAKLGIVAERG